MVAMKITGWIIGIVISGFIFIMIVGTALRTPESDARMATQQGIDDLCDKMMSDAALGNERRNTREMCDALKARAAKK